MKNLLTQWETEEENLRINLIKNLLTQWETKKENQKTGNNVLLIDKEHNSNVLLLNSKHSGDMLLIAKNLQNWKMILNVYFFWNLQSWKIMLNVHLLKLTELLKKPFNLTKTGKEKSHCPISHSLARFIELDGWSCFHFVEGLTDWTDGLAMSRAELRRGEVAVGFSG